MTSSWVAPLMGLAVLCWAEPAGAQRVVVLEVKGDPKGKMRDQIERAIKKSKKAQVVQVRTYRLAAAKQKLTGARAITPAAVAKVSRRLALGAALSASVAKSLRVRIWDSSGTEVWRGEFPLSHGRLSAQHAHQLAARVSAAMPRKAREPPPSELKEAVSSQTPEIASIDSSAKPMDSTQQSIGASRTADREDREQREPEDVTEAHTTTVERRLEGRAPPAAIGPDFLRAQVTGTTTWRSYCSRPGVSSCSQYQQLDPAQRPPGDTVDFSPDLPYVGFALAVDFFPLSKDKDLWRGVGVLAGYERGFSRTDVRTQTPTGDAPARRVYSSDQDLRVAATYRYFFQRGDSAQPLVGYGGLRLGFASRSFETDSNPAAPLPGSHRSYPTLAIDGSVPLSKLLRLDAIATYFISPKPRDLEIRDYGTAASSSGFGLELGAGGDLWGPLGYVIRFRLSKYSDRFVGQGSKWLEGGVARETYVGLYWGASARF